MGNTSKSCLLEEKETPYSYCGVFVWSVGRTRHNYYKKEVLSMNSSNDHNTNGHYVYSRCITNKKGVKVYHPTGGVYRFWVAD